MDFCQGVTRSHSLDLDLARARALELGFAVFVLPASGVVDRSSFFAAVKSVCRLDPPAGSGHVWDALSDSLFGGLCELPEQRIAIFWPNARAMESAAAGDFEIAFGVFEEVAQQLSDAEVTGGASKLLAVVVE